MKKSRHNFKARRIGKELKGIIVDSVNAATEQLSTEIKKELSKYDTRKGKPPAAPNGPGLRTGKLRRSFRTRKAKRVGDKILTRLGSNVKYSYWLEFGANLPGGQPFFKSKKIAKKQKNPIPGTDIAFAKKSSRFAKRMKKTKPSTLKPRPYVGRTLKNAKVVEQLRSIAQSTLNAGLRNLRNKAPKL